MKKILAVLGCVMVMAMFSGCGNRQVFDTNYKFNYAVLYHPDGTEERLHIVSWRDFSEYPDQIQFTTDNGDVYLTSIHNVILLHQDL